jgi:transcriptional regulator with XRE-family HTH domain
MARWRKPTRDESRAQRADIAARARTGQLEIPGAIVDMRRALELSRDEFARVFKLTRRQLAEIERGEGNPTIETLNRIGRPFGFGVGFVPVSDASSPRPGRRRAKRSSPPSLPTVPAGGGNPSEDDNTKIRRDGS